MGRTQQLSYLCRGARHWAQRAVLTPASPSVDQSSCSFFCFQGKFLAFYQYAKSFNSDDFDYEELKNGDYVFMRWKVRSQPSQSLCCMQCPLCPPGPVLITACLHVVPLHALKKQARLQAPLASCCHASRFVFGDTVWWFTDEFVAGRDGGRPQHVQLSRLSHPWCSVDSGELQSQSPSFPTLSREPVQETVPSPRPSQAAVRSQLVWFPPAGNEGPGMEFGFSTHQPSENSIWLDWRDWLGADKSLCSVFR